MGRSLLRRAELPHARGHLHRRAPLLRRRLAALTHHEEPASGIAMDGPAALDLLPVFADFACVLDGVIEAETAVIDFDPGNGPARAPALYRRCHRPALGLGHGADFFDQSVEPGIALVQICAEGNRLLLSADIGVLALPSAGEVERIRGLFHEALLLGLQMLLKPRHQLRQIAGPMADIELPAQDVFPAVAAGARGARKGEEIGAARHPAGGAALDGGGADLLEAQPAEELAESLDLLFEQGFEGFGDRKS